MPRVVPKAPPPGSSEGSEEPSSTGSLALTSPGSKKPCCEAQTLVLCTAARSPPGHRDENSQGWCFIMIYENMENAMIFLHPSSPCIIIPSLLLVSFIYLGWEEKKTIVWASYFSALSYAFAVPAAWRLL